MIQMRDTTHPADGAVLPLGPGDTGDAVLDLQQRLAALQLVSDDAPGEYGEHTARAVGELQARRGLPANGLCDRHTWSALVEAGYRLGDRPLYRREPMMRGDDVAELQRRLSTLGFDPGRIDGIFGDQTRTVVTEFQRNVALTPDGLCGSRTLAELLRVTRREGDADLVTPLRERLRLAGEGSGSLQGRRIAVTEGGGFAAAAAAVCRALGDTGATALAFHHPDPSHQAAEANAAEVDCVVSLRLEPGDSTCSTAFYSGFRYESVASRNLAELIQAQLPGALGLDDGGVRGMSLPILRETQMPAIDVQLGSPTLVVQRTAALAHVIVICLASWIDASRK